MTPKVYLIWLQALGIKQIKFNNRNVVKEAVNKIEGEEPKNKRRGGSHRSVIKKK